MIMKNKNRTDFREIIMTVSALVCIASLCVTVGLQLKYRNISSVPETKTILKSETASAENSFVMITKPEETMTLAETVRPEATLTSPETTERATASKNEKSTRASAPATTAAEKSTEIDSVLIINTKTKKIHSHNCSYVTGMSEENKKQISGDELQQYLDNGYSVCGRCHAYKTEG